MTTSGDVFRLAADWLPDDLADAAIVYVDTDRSRRGRAFAALEQAVRTYQETQR